MKCALSHQTIKAKRSKSLMPRSRNKPRRPNGLGVYPTVEQLEDELFDIGEEGMLDKYGVHRTTLKMWFKKAPYEADLPPIEICGGYKIHHQKNKHHGNNILQSRFTRYQNSKW